MMHSAIQYLERAAAQWPDRPAVEHLEEILTYRQLRQRCLALGTGLLDRGAAGAPVAVLLPRTPAALAAFYGALYAGTCYVPLDYQEADGRLLKLLAEVVPEGWT